MENKKNFFDTKTLIIKRMIFVKWLYLLTLNPISINAQLYKTYRDYKLIRNIDSLEKSINNTKTNSHLYLHTLNILERSRRWVRSDNFGKDFDKIERLATEQKSELALAANFLHRAYNYNITGKDTLAYKYYIKAIEHFDKIKDTTGQVLAYNSLLILNIGVNKKISQMYFDKLLKLSLKSNFITDKVIGLGYIMESNDLLNPAPDIKTMQSAFDDCIKLIDENPEYSFLRKPIIGRIQTGVYKLQDYNLLLKYARIGYKYRDGIRDYNELFNVSNAFFSLKQYDSSIVYAKKAIREFKKEKATDNVELQKYYVRLSEALYSVKRFKEAYNIVLLKDSLTNVILENSQKVALLDIQTKYESDKKDLTIQKLAFEKQMADNRNLLIFGCLILALLMVSLISILALRLKKVNSKLQQLQKERDKLFTIISHDLRSPLNTYQQFSSIVKSLVKTKQYARLDSALQQMDLLGLNLASMLNGLLQWSLLEQKNTIIKPSYINTKTYFENLLPIYYKMAELKSIRLNVNVSERNIYIDVNVLSVILRNLIDNAIKHNDKGHEIKINAEQVDKYFNISIINDSDLKNNVQKQKLKDFFEGKREYTFGEDGLGIGLILVKEYAQICNAKLSFESGVDGYITVCLAIPNIVK